MRGERKELNAECLWKGTSGKADRWAAELGASAYVVRALKFGIRDMPAVPFKEGVVMGEVPQSAADRVFAEEDLRKGCNNRVYERVGVEEVRRLVRNGKMVSSAFTVWQGEGSERKGRFVVNLHRQSEHWPKGSVRMETMQSFAMEMQKGDKLMSWDVKSGYRHFYLHPDMRDFFVFRYGGRYYRCIAIPFGWGRSALWFVKLLRPLVQHMRERMAYRVLPYLDDFLIAPTPAGVVSGEEDCKRAGRRLGSLLKRLGIVRHPEKGRWDGARQLDHLGVHVDTEAMRVFVTEAKVTRVRRLASKLILMAQRNRRLVPLELVRHFCGVCVSLTLALPLARFYTRSLYFDMSLADKEYESTRGLGRSPNLRKNFALHACGCAASRSETWDSGVRWPGERGATCRGARRTS